MYINGKKLYVRRYSSGELKLVRSELDKYIECGKVKILYVGGYTLFELILIIKYYKSIGVVVDLILGYLPYQRMDHKDRDELDTVSYVADIFNKLDLNSIFICEPHCEIEMFNRGKKISIVNLLKEKAFKDIGFDEEDIVVLADKGGLRRYQGISKNVVYFNKVRDIDTGLIIKHEIVGDVDVSKKVMIVDDIISTGDTIVNIINHLICCGVKDIYVLAGHIENNKYNKRIYEFSNVIKVYSTSVLRKKGNSKLKLYDLKKLLENI